MLARSALFQLKATALLAVPPQGTGARAGACLLLVLVKLLLKCSLGQSKCDLSWGLVRAFADSAFRERGLYAVFLLPGRILPW